MTSQTKKAPTAKTSPEPRAAVRSSRARAAAELDSQTHSMAVGQSLQRKSLFARFADWAARMTGSPIGFTLAVVACLIWAVTGPVFLFSDTWQLVINTGTTVLTFLMVFLVQATQNRDSAAIHVKLDELVRSLDAASNELLDLEERNPQELEEIRSDYEKLAETARNGKKR